MDAENPLYCGVRPRCTIPIKSCFSTKVNGCIYLCLKGIPYIWVVCLIKKKKKIYPIWVVCLKGIFRVGPPIILVGWLAIGPVLGSWAIW